MALVAIVVQSLSHVWLFMTPWIAACLASLSFIISQNLLKLMLTESVMPSNHRVLCLPSFCYQSFPASGYFTISQLLASGGQSIGALTSALVLPKNIQGWFLLGLIGLISLLSKGLSIGLSSTTIRKHWSFGVHPSLWSNSNICTWLLEKRSFDHMDLCK